MVINVNTLVRTLESLFVFITEIEVEVHVSYFSYYGSYNRVWCSELQNLNGIWEPKLSTCLVIKCVRPGCKNCWVQGVLMVTASLWRMLKVVPRAVVGLCVECGTRWGLSAQRWWGWKTQGRSHSQVMVDRRYFLPALLGITTEQHWSCLTPGAEVRCSLLQNRTVGTARLLLVVAWRRTGSAREQRASGMELPRTHVVSHLWMQWHSGVLIKV